MFIDRIWEIEDTELNTADKVSLHNSIISHPSKSCLVGTVSDCFQVTTELVSPGLVGNGKICVWRQQRDTDKSEIY
jgi:hypothetical protein